FHATRCLNYGTKVVAGVTPGRGGQRFEGKVPVFNSVEQAVRETGANCSVIFVPPAGAADAMVEAAEAGVALVICITEGVPVLDTLKVVRYLEGRPARLIGPNCPGVITPGARCKIGIMPASIHTPGRVGVVSRSGTLTYEAVKQLTDLGIGQSTCVGIGGDPIGGTTFVDVLQMFNDDPETDAVVMIGEIGGTAEQDAAAYVKESFRKPLAAFIVGQTAPPGKRMGHAGAVIAGPHATAAAKMEALRDAGALVAPRPGAIGATLREAMERAGVRV
ncbi:MAG: succinate--CoA ligase subunit alpha, partial [Chloroflexi bacterium]|nr:succinate--CoA ligase subunit alpha [Chloroflexota bacterium]